MGYKNIDDIAVIATALADSDKIEVRQGGATKKSALSTLRDYIQGALSFPSQTIASASVTRTLGSDQTTRVTVRAKIPAGWYAKLVATVVSGTASATYFAGCEQTEG